MDVAKTSALAVAAISKQLLADIMMSFSMQRFFI
jgi:hypothetical protein